MYMYKLYIQHYYVHILMRKKVYATVPFAGISFKEDNNVLDSS